MPGVHVHVVSVVQIHIQAQIHHCFLYDWPQAIKTREGYSTIWWLRANVISVAHALMPFDVLRYL